MKMHLLEVTSSDALMEASSINFRILCICGNEVSGVASYMPSNCQLEEG